jgi:hypothetical protein
MMKAKMMAKGGMHKMPDGKMMKDSAMKNLAKHAAKPASKAHAGLRAGGMAKDGMSGFPIKRKGPVDKKTVAKLASKILDAKMGAAPMVSPMAPPMMSPGMKNGGSVSKRADGIAQRGRTKGTMLRKGGRVC